MDKLNKIMAILAASQVFSMMSNSQTLDVDGGVTYDFAQISARRFQPETNHSTNLLRNGDFSVANDPDDPSDPYRWRNSYCFIHNPDNVKIPSWQSKVRSLVKWELGDGVASIIKMPELAALCGPMTKDTSGAWSQIVRLPDMNGGAYQLAFQYQAKHDSIGANYVLAVYKGDHSNPDRSPDLDGARTMPFPDVWGDWGLFNQEITAPAGARYLNLIFRIDGVGALKMKNVGLTPVVKKEKLTFTLSPQGFLDSHFTLSQHQPALMTFVWKRNGTASEAQLRKPSMVLQFPTEIMFKQSTSAEGFTIRKLDSGTEVRVALSSGYWQRPAIIDGFDFYLVLTALVTTDAAPGAVPGLGRGWIEEEGAIVSNQETFTFSVIPSIRAKAKARNYLPGFYIGGRYMQFDDANNEFMAQFLGDLGVRWIIGNPAGNQLEMWRKYHIDVVTPELYYVANGFRVGDPKGRPEEDRFTYLGSNSHPDLNTAACPVAIYEKRPYYRDVISNYIRDNLQGTDGLWANWEPYMFAGKGCFCDTCRQKFAAFVQVPLEHMKNEWPQELTRGKKYYEQAVRFRSLEHAKLVTTIHETVVAATGGERSKGFIPGIAWIEMASCWREIPNGKEVHQSDYAANLRWIDPWGPYPCWNTQTPYVYRKADNLSTFIAARDVRNQVNQDYPPDKRPKLLAFPHGIQGTAWVTHPETLEMDLNSFFFNGFEAATAYIFPRGYDNRYWAAFARAAENAADYEDFVMDGERIDDRITLTPLPPYAANASKVTNHLPGVTTAPMLQHAAFQLQDKIIIPIFNFWEQGSCFFRLRIAGLAPAGKYQVTAKQQLFAPKRVFRPRKYFYTGAELAAGVELFVGAMRCLVYELTPGVALDEISYTPSLVRELRKARLSELQAAAAADAEYEKRYGPKESSLYNLEHAGIHCQAEAGKNELRLTAETNSLTLNCRAMSIIDWQVDGQKQLGGQENSGFGTVAFWEPSYLVEGTYLITRQEKIPGGILVVGELRLLDQLSTVFDGLTIRQSFAVTDSCRNVVVKTELLNTSSDEAPRTYRVGLRYHCFPMALAAPGGYVELRHDGKPFPFRRNFGRTLFSTGDKAFEEVVRKTFAVAESPRPIDSATALFHTSANRSELQLTPESHFAGYALWDDGSQLTTTFEPCFRIVTLEKSDEPACFTMSMTIK